MLAIKMILCLVDVMSMGDLPIRAVMTVTGAANSRILSCSLLSNTWLQRSTLELRLLLVSLLTSPLLLSCET